MRLTKHSLFLCLGIGTMLAACTGDKQSSESAGGDTGSDTDHGGEGQGSVWSTKGSGQAYFVDGSEDNSVLYLEITVTMEPRSGEGYFGWLSGEGAKTVALGEITVDGTAVTFEYDIGTNGLLGGYDTFDAWAGADEDSAQSGDHLWTGRIDPDLKGAYENLLMESKATKMGEGSLRSVESSCEDLIIELQTTIDETQDVSSIYDQAEAIVNAINGTSEDIDSNGTTNTLSGIMPILGKEGLIELILSHLDVASASVGPGHPVKDLANWAYDCTQMIEGFAEQASREADTATVCGSKKACDAELESAIENLQWALDGFDADKDGTVDPISEGTAECAIYFVSQMAYMDVATP
jgi:hypothetical protein